MIQTRCCRVEDWVLEKIGPDILVPFTVFIPDYQLVDLPLRSVATLERARDGLRAKECIIPMWGMSRASGKSHLLPGL